MKLSYSIVVALITIVMLAGCKNRFEEYEPYSAFDDRMASAEKGRPYPPDDRMPPAVDDQYSYSGASDDGYMDNDQASSSMRMSERNTSSSSSQNAEVPFSSSRSPDKHPVNIGAN